MQDKAAVSLLLAILRQTLSDAGRMTRSGETRDAITARIFARGARCKEFCEYADVSYPVFLLLFEKTERKRKREAKRRIGGNEYER